MYQRPHVHKEQINSLMRLKGWDFFAPAYELKSIQSTNTASAPSLDPKFVIVCYLGADLVNLNLLSLFMLAPDKEITNRQKPGRTVLVGMEICFVEEAAVGGLEAGWEQKNS